jgi:hypothetical protein
VGKCVWIDLAQDRDQWRALVNTAMNCYVSWKRVISWPAEWLLVSDEWLCSTALFGLVWFG